MSDFEKQVVTHFGFLVPRFGDVLERHGPSKLKLAAPKVLFRFSTTDRDGLDVTFGRLAMSGTTSEAVKESLSLGVMIAAIHTWQGKYIEGEEQSLEVLAAGLREYGNGIIEGDGEFFTRIAELRFRHVGKWIEKWGKAIAMTPQEMLVGREVVPSILALATPIRD